ncbi:MAG: phosphate uptake regulator PhoU [Candidatus Bathyarchaeota archaeon]|nr:phosphate uptake regulator PhoU [Candidatus Bathyarchaeota archaeon]
MGELRKVQRTQSGTFFVCLPKPWAEHHGLKRGSVVAINETSDSRLLIDPKYDVEPSPHTITLRPGPYLSREIVGKYLLGFDIIHVEAKKRISFEVRDIVKKTVSRLIGLEIVEEDYSRIVLQCLLEPSGFPPEKILRRGYAIAAGMHRDVVNALVDGDLHLAKSVIARDDEVNRLYFLLVRILRTVIQTPGLSEKLGVRPIECLDYRLAASLVEAIGDECVRAALKTVELKATKLTEDLKKLLVDFHMVCFEAHENALKAFFTGAIDLAESVRDMWEKIEKTFANIEKGARAQSLDIVPHILAVASILRQVYEHSVDIADLVMPKKL